MNKSFILATALFGATALSAQSLTSLPNFVANNGGAPGGAVYFDLDANVDLSIFAVELNYNTLNVGDPCGCEIYVRTGTFAGNEATAAGWLLVATDDGTATTAGVDVPTPVALNRAVCINAGGTVGVAIVATGAAGHAYTNGNGTNETVSDANLTFTGGSGSNVPFTGPTFNPRVANCTLTYAVGACTPTPISIPRLSGAVDARLVPGALSEDTESFVGGDDLRIVTNDASGSTAGAPLAYFLNAGPAGANPTSTTSFVPGFVQTWSGSALPGIDIILPGVEGLETTLATPVGFGEPGGTLRFQAVAIDFNSTNPFGFPITPTQNTKTFAVALDPALCVATEGFEASLTLPATWRTTPGQLAWTVDSGGTTSGSTGPNSAIEGLNYVYTETSGPAGNPNVAFGLESQLIDPAVTTVDGISFQLSRIGATIGDLTVNLIDDAGTVLVADIFSSTGPGAEWEQQVVLFSAPAVPYRVQFAYVSGTSFTGDIALDDVCFFDIP